MVSASMGSGFMGSSVQMLRPVVAFGGRTTGLLALVAGCAAPAVLAEPLRLSPDRDTLALTLAGRDLRVARSGDAARDCPPICVRPITAADGVRTLGEAEVIEFIAADLAAGRGVLIDVRGAAAFASGHLPGAVNVPAETLRPDNVWRRDILVALGAVEGGGALDFAAARSVVIHDSGSGAGEAIEAIRSLLDAGYPAGRIGWYRGGVDDWTALDLELSVGEAG